LNGALKAWIPKLAGQRILVVGDVILDEYVFGRATRMSREAPVPVLEFESRQMIPGGAANPAVNIARLGSAAVQVAVTGADMAATQLRQLLQVQGIEANALVKDAARPTTVKMRLMAHMGLRFPQQVARLDTLSREPISSSVAGQLYSLIEHHIEGADAVLISDYHGGLLTEALVNAIRSLAAEHPVLLTADAQGELDKYHHFGLVKCNTEDARSYLGRLIEGDDDFGAAAQALCERLRLTGAMVITRGPEGATIATPDGAVHHCPSPAVTDVYDVVGAGDTAIAVMTLAAAAGAPYPEAIMLANYASGLVVRRVGNYAPNPDELAWALDTWSHGS
jgi:D-glycero-beta-D-manno-heptose-7-phosphate kinase